MNKDLITKEIGYVTSTKGYLLSLNGLPSVRINDIIEDDTGNRAMVASLEKDHITALLLDDILPRAGDRFSYSAGEKILFPVGEHLFGRVVDTLGRSLDGKGNIPQGDVPIEFDVVAGGISTRKEITEQFTTGVSLIDTLFPIGKGQRQLLFGPTLSGKTGFFRDTIVNQKGKNIICIYVGIGKPIFAIESFTSHIFAEGADEYTIVVAALAESQTPMITIAPTVGFHIAEHFRKQGKDILLILDDLGTHAKYLREISLLSKRIPGRQSYPGDIFYQHAHLLERAGNFNEEYGGGSITVFPVLETDIENFIDLIPTNIMATTDGHLFFSPMLQAQGYTPSVAIDRSVTRVGRQTQMQLQKELATKLMALFVEYDRQKEYIRFGTNVSSKTQNILKQGEIAQELLRQEHRHNISLNIQVILLSLAFSPFLLDREVSFTRANKENLVNTLENEPKLQDLRDNLKNNISLNDHLRALGNKIHILEKACQP